MQRPNPITVLYCLQNVSTQLKGADPFNLGYFADKGDISQHALRSKADLIMSLTM